MGRSQRMREAGTVRAVRRRWKLLPRHQAGTRASQKRRLDWKPSLPGRVAGVARVTAGVAGVARVARVARWGRTCPRVRWSGGAD